MHQHGANIKKWERETIRHRKGNAPDKSTSACFMNILIKEEERFISLFVCYLLFVLDSGRPLFVVSRSGHRMVLCCDRPIVWVDCVWNVMAHAQKPDFVFRRNGRVHLNRRWRQFSRLLAAEVCTSAVVMLDTPCCEVLWRVVATHSIRQFSLRFPSHASPCAITFQLESTTAHW